ncbi:MAG: WD40 repeat domain-containing protein [Gaiellaceae bacterium]
MNANTHNGPVESVAFSPGDTLLATAGKRIARSGVATCAL